MPEGHSVRRLAQQFGDVFTGEPLSVSSPQGRFVAGAAVLDGQVLTDSRAHGKHLFLHFDHAVVLHVHLGLYGAWDFGGDATFSGASSIGAPRKIGEREVFEDPEITDDAGMVEYAGPPEPRGAVRVRLVSRHGWADLRGATTCAAITEAEARAVLARLGPDPLHNHPADRTRFVTGLLSRKTSIAALLMDQKVIAGVGNVYRAEVLFRQRLDPWLPGTGLSSGAAGLLWDDTAAVMADGVRDGRMITTPPVYWEPDYRESGHGESGVALPSGGDAHFVYKREGQPCRVCAVPVAITEMVGRKLYWCPGCQQ
ncbi:formamidopyrimidine-DNA glycosylase [Arthrobacter sp. UYNi723]